MKSIVLIGSIPLATKVLRYLYKHESATIVGIVCDRTSKRYEFDYFTDVCVYDAARELSLPFTTIEEVQSNYGEGAVDLAFSCRAPYILKPRFLSRFHKGVVNFHGGSLPELRGVHIANHAIIQGYSRSAGTLHYMDEGIDTGPIIAKQYFDIGPHDTALDVFHKTQQALWSVFCHNIDAILRDEETITPQSDYIEQGCTPTYFNRHALEQSKQVSLEMTVDKLYRHVRGCDFPGHEPAYLMIDGRKVYLTVQKFFSQYD